MNKVLISDKMNDDAKSIFEARGVAVDYKPGLSPEEQRSIIGDYAGLVIRSTTKVDKAMLDAAINLKVVGRAGIGVDNVDLQASTAAGVVVMNTPFGNAVTTAEHAIGLMFSAARLIPQAHSSTHAGLWEKSKFMGRELTGKTMGLIGSGNIGRNVIERALGLKMKVLAYDPYLAPELIRDLGAEPIDLQGLLTRADVISLHVPLTTETCYLLGKEQFEAMKPSTIVINCARGGLIDEKALVEALDKGEIAAAALDVYEVEPAKDSPVFGHPKVVCTPHLGASTSEAQEKVALQVAEQIADFLMEGAVANALNAPSLTADQARILAPYLRLAGNLGSMAGQLCAQDGQCEIKGVKFRFDGEAHVLNWAPLKQSMLHALLAPQLSHVNMVNAAVIAQERGIRVEDQGSPDKPLFNTLIEIEVETALKTRSIRGTLYGQGLPRVVGIKGIEIESAFSRHMLYVSNIDKPGFIGALGQVLAEADINIGSFNLGRNHPGGDAIALVELDSLLSGDQLAQLGRIPQVKGLAQLSFSDL